MQCLGQNLHNRNITKVRQNESSNMPPLSVNRGALKFSILTKRRNKDCNNNNNKKNKLRIAMKPSLELLKNKLPLKDYRINKGLGSLYSAS